MSNAIESNMLKHAKWQDERIVELEAINKAHLEELRLMQVEYSFSDHYERKLKLEKAVEALKAIVYIRNVLSTETGYVDNAVAVAKEALKEIK